ncbi:MAG: hypothetical protein J6B75_02040 [Ruminococcus sp.]|nr:hypothetical protein [Ruminococcus sp.]
MNSNIILPDSIGYLLIGFGVVAVAVYIKSAIDDIIAARHERAVREFKAAVEADKVSRALADFYTAAAYGDPDDCDYWEETAKQFMGGLQ